MSELKKLTEIIENQLSSNIGIIFDAQQASLIDRYNAHLNVKDGLKDLVARIKKLVTKARETNPEKKIFNEKTCAKIEGLFLKFGFLLDKYFGLNENSLPSSVKSKFGNFNVSSSNIINNIANSFNGYPENYQDNAVEMKIDKKIPFSLQIIMYGDGQNQNKDLCEKADHHDVAEIDNWENSDTVSEIELKYAAQVVREAEEKSKEMEVAKDINSLVLFENYEHEVIIMLEKTCRNELLQEFKLSKITAWKIMEEKELAIWERELSRRKKELDAIHSKCCEKNAFFDSINLIKNKMGYTSWRKLMNSFIELVSEVINHPENENIRTIRNNSLSTIFVFGHPCIHPTRNFYTSCEIILACLGYNITYSKHLSDSTLKLQSIIEENKLKISYCMCFLDTSEDKNYKIDKQNDFSSLNSVNHHCPLAKYISLGFEKYCERSLVLREPSASTDPDTWFAWYNDLKAKLIYMKGIL